ncbi:MAG TPA: four helix bundle protein [Williamwhitmania sp.]|nr:four helix bundle protein [Williamwhitmania sp.]
MDELNRKTKSFEDLLVWQKAHSFVLIAYEITSNYPRLEQFGLTSQFRRAAISIPANIAEGYKKKGKLDKLRFFNIAQASIEESRYYLILSKDLKYIDDKIAKEATSALIEVSFLLNSYCNAITQNG